jgi:hypothetical protein
VGTAAARARPAVSLALTVDVQTTEREPVVEKSPGSRRETPRVLDTEHRPD